jgi:DNA polymerase III alpha subunit (gram-positive type)
MADTAPERNLIFLDLETTGLLPHHQIWEAAWAVDDGDVQSALWNHTLDKADPFALGINNYSSRVKGWDSSPEAEEARAESEYQLKQVIKGQTIVAANPTFDSLKLRERWGQEIWHYRMIDIESYALPFFNRTQTIGLNFIATELGIDVPDHSAAQDVATLRECFYKLEFIYNEWHRTLDSR